ncbi:MAG: hypothetical protein GY928_32290 [Colwellia sp.]|nr:hypothetical protein [Colwellia sp.]
MSKAAISATYVNYKRIASRKIMQLHFEVPLEQWPEFYKVLGEPNIDTSQWFAIAKMDAKEPSPTPEDTGANLTANAAIMLGEGSFQKFLSSRYPVTCLDRDSDFDKVLKEVLKITSKRELNTDPAAAIRWRDLRAEYEAWMKT